MKTLLSIMEKVYERKHKRVAKLKARIAAREAKARADLDKLHAELSLLEQDHEYVAARRYLAEETQRLARPAAA